jgi:hypothetical protein
MNIYPLTPESTKRFASPNTSPIRRESKSPSIEKNNVKVDNIAFTEHGFHYLLSSIENDSSLLFDQLSFYSDVLFKLGQQIAIKIKTHKYQVFSRYNGT